MECVIIKQMMSGSKKEKSPFVSIESDPQSCSWLISSWRRVCMAWDLGNVLEDLISRAVTNGSMDKRIGGGDEDGGMAMNLLGSIK